MADQSLDLDAIAAAVEAMAQEPWQDEGDHISDGNAMAVLYADNDPETAEPHYIIGVSDVAGIIALRNAAPALLALARRVEVLAPALAELRAVVRAADAHVGNLELRGMVLPACRRLLALLSTTETP